MGSIGKDSSTEKCLLLICLQYSENYIQTIEENYGSYQECISEDTEIADIEEYKLVLRHPDTQQAFIGYEFDPNTSVSLSRKNEKNTLAQNFMSTTMREKRHSLLP